MVTVFYLVTYYKTVYPSQDYTPVVKEITWTSLAMRKLLILPSLLFLCGWIAGTEAATCGYDVINITLFFFKFLMIKFIHFPLKGCTAGKAGVINVHVVPRK